MNLVQSMTALKKKKLLFFFGDFNAKIGCDNTAYEEVMGRQGLGDMNDNRKRFANLWDMSYLVIGSSIFPHQRIHK